MKAPVKQVVAVVTREITVKSGENILDLIETDQVAPAGRWRLRLDGDKIHFDRATAVDWSTYETWLTYDKANEKLTLGKKLDAGALKIENLGAPDSDDDVPRRDTIDSKIATHKGDASAHHTPPTKVRKAADETVNNSISLQDDDHLFFAMEANEVWEVLVLPIFSGTPTADAKLRIAVPTDATFFGYCSYFAPDETYTARKLSLGDIFSVGVYGAATPRCVAVLNLVVINGANAGNFQIQWAQNVAEVSDTIMKANSCIIAHKLS